MQSLLFKPRGAQSPKNSISQFGSYPLAQKSNFRNFVLTQVAVCLFTGYLWDPLFYDPIIKWIGFEDNKVVIKIPLCHIEQSLALGRLADLSRKEEHQCETQSQEWKLPKTFWLYQAEFEVKLRGLPRKRHHDSSRQVSGPRGKSRGTCGPVVRLKEKHSLALL